MSRGLFGWEKEALIGLIYAAKPLRQAFRQAFACLRNTIFGPAAFGHHDSSTRKASNQSLHSTVGENTERKEGLFLYHSREVHHSRPKERPVPSRHLVWVEQRWPIHNTILGSTPLPTLPSMATHNPTNKPLHPAIYQTPMLNRNSSYSNTNPLHHKSATLSHPRRHRGRHTRARTLALTRSMKRR